MINSGFMERIDQEIVGVTVAMQVSLLTPPDTPDFLLGMLTALLVAKSPDIESSAAYEQAYAIWFNIKKQEVVS